MIFEFFEKIVIGLMLIIFGMSVLLTVYGCIMAVAWLLQHYQYPTIIVLVILTILALSYWIGSAWKRANDFPYTTDAPPPDYNGYLGGLDE